MPAASLRVATLAHLLILTMCLSAWAEEKSANSSGPPFVEEFQIGAEGRFIVLPVRIGERNYRFLLDTGATITGFDKQQKNLLGANVGLREIWTPGGRLKMKTYQCPEAHVGSLKLGDGNKVFCTDMTLLCQGLGEEIDGVLGMDFLRDHIVQVDFDAGRLRIMKPAPTALAEWGEPVAMSTDRRNGVTIGAKLCGATEETFLLDTGANTNSLAASRFHDLVDAGKLNVLSTTHQSLTANGEVRGRSGRLDSISVGTFSHRSLRFDESPISSLGLRYLARYFVTFDFPNNVLYLKPGAAHFRLNQPATSGLSVSKVNGQFCVTAVNDRGPAAKAGVKPDDVIIRIDRRNVDDLDLFAVGKALTSAVGKNISLTILRGAREIEVAITLEDRHAGK